MKLAAAPRRELPKDTLTMRAAGCMPAVGAKRVQNVVNAIEKWVPFTPKFSQRRWLLELRSRPPNSEGERLRRLPVLHAELKMVLTQFKNRIHSHPNAPNSVGGEGKRFRRFHHVEMKMVLKLFKNGFHLHPNTPKSVGGWDSAPDPHPIALREIAFGVCQSDTPG